MPSVLPLGELPSAASSAAYAVMASGLGSAHTGCAVVLFKLPSLLYVLMVLW